MPAKALRYSDRDLNISFFTKTSDGDLPARFINSASAMSVTCYNSFANDLKLDSLENAELRSDLASLKNEVAQLKAMVSGK